MCVLLVAKLARRAAANVADNGCVALVVGEWEGRHALQFKGRRARCRPATPEECARGQARHLALGRSSCAMFQIPIGFYERWPIEGTLAVEFEVESVFEQSPGAGAGRALEDHPGGAA
jgi:hypothetical protein